MASLRRRIHRGQRDERQKTSLRSKLKSLGARVKRRTFPVLTGPRTIDRKVLARVRGVESAPLTHVDDYGDAAAYGRAFDVMTGVSERPGDPSEPVRSPSGP